MKHKFITFLAFGSLLIFSACSQQEPMSPELTATDKPQSIESSQQLDSFGHGPGSVTVMTRNIYVGTDVDMVLSAQSPEQVPFLVAEAFQLMLSTNFPERAISLAKEIAITRPQLIGLQEVSLVRLQSPGDAVVGGTTPAEEVFLDYLDILMTALNACGLDYKVAGKIQNADVEFPMIVGTDPLKFDDVRLTDYDVVLALDDVKISNVTEVNYQVALPVPSVGIEIPRGYVAVDAKVGRKTYRFVNTHLEPVWSDEVLQIQLAQAQELLASLQDEILPVIIVGDFNSQASTGATYQLIQSQGYLDIWTQNHLTNNPDGYTFGHDPDLRNEEANFYERIDLIFVRNKLVFPEKQVLDPVVAIVVGDELLNRTPSGLWPSDHGGVVARLRIPTSRRIVQADETGEGPTIQQH